MASMRYPPKPTTYVSLGFSILPEYCYNCLYTEWLEKGWRVVYRDHKRWLCLQCAPTKHDANHLAW